MSALGAAVGKGIGAVGGPQVAAVVVAVGLVVGALGGGLIAGGQGQQATTRGGLAIYPCPDSGPALATVGSGQKFLVDRQERRRELGAHLLPAAGPHRGVGHVRAAPDRGLDRRDPGRALLAGRSPGRDPRASRARR